jgi:hypothetical protein
MAFMEEDIYAAGLFDGEGTVTLSTANGKFRHPVVSVSSTTLCLLEFLQTHYGGHVSTHKTYKAHHTASWSWKARYDEALAFLEKVLPYLKEPEKRRRALLLTQDYKKVTRRNGRYSPEQLEQKLNLEQRFFHPSDS